MGAFEALRNVTQVPSLAAQPRPTAIPIRALVVARRIRGRIRFVVQVGLTDGSSREIASPFQKPAYQGIAAALRDLNGDGTFDAVLFSARKALSRRKVRRMVRF